ncbi:MAG: hypothetical protein Q9208_001287 [Pyrenodesmia sp. 3 TL-2023]
MIPIVPFAWSICCLAYIGWVSAQIDQAGLSPKDILNYDVCVIGGGAAGTYAAIRLRDLNKTVAVVETQGRLGGHTVTYTDPASKATIDIGVIVVNNDDLTKNYFGRFNISLTVANFDTPGVTTEYVDFRTGEIVTGYAPPNGTAAYRAYAAQLAKYPFLDLSLGNIPQSVPADLLLSFGDFIEKYSLQDAIPQFYSYGQGFGNILNLPALYAFKYYNTNNFQTALTTSGNDNSKLYREAQAELGADAFLNSNILAMDRSDPNFVKVLVKTPSGHKLIRAKKILSTIPPLFSNLRGFDLDATELPLFKKFMYHTYYAGLINNSAIPDTLQLQNVGKDTPYNLPVLPAAYYISPTKIPGLHFFQAGTPETEVLSSKQIQAEVVASIKRMRAVGVLPSTNATPNYAIFANHVPYSIYVPPSVIATGFYNKVFALQGRKNTYWSGAAFVTHDSSAIWKYTETLIKDIAA